jgi:hypothetical protein
MRPDFDTQRLMAMQTDSFSEQKELSRLDDPAVRNRCVKLRWRSNFQSGTLWATLVLFFIAFVLLDRGYAGYTPRYSHQHHPPNPALIPYGWAALEVSAGLLMVALICQNYCLLDPSEHRLYQHFGFLWWRKRKIVFRAGEVLAITVDGKSRSSRYGVRWYYRLVAVGIDGRKQPLSNWRQRSLQEWNARARELAPQFGCASQMAPEKSVVSVEQENGVAKLTFDGPTPTSMTRRVLAIIIIVVMALIYFFALVSKR